MTDAPHETSMLLGEMKAQIAALTAAVGEQFRKSDERGARTYRELEQIRLNQAEMKRDVQSVKQVLDDKTEGLKVRLDAAEPTLKEINRWRERFIGMQMLLGAGAAAIGGIMVYFWKWVSVKIGIN